MNKKVNISSCRASEDGPDFFFGARESTRSGYIAATHTLSNVMIESTTPRTKTEQKLRSRKRQSTRLRQRPILRNGDPIACADDRAKAQGTASFKYTRYWRQPSSSMAPHTALKYIDALKWHQEASRFGSQASDVTRSWRCTRDGRPGTCSYIVANMQLEAVSAVYGLPATEA